MPPTGEEYRTTARRTLMVLRADLGLALEGAAPSLTAARGVAKEMRLLCERALKALGERGAAEFFDELQRARDRMIAVFGASAWDEMEAEGPLPTLTDLQLSDLRRHFEERPDMERIQGQMAIQVRSALAELQRLRLRVEKLDKRPR
jgi:hypothetical protein